MYKYSTLIMMALCLFLSTDSFSENGSNLSPTDMLQNQINNATDNSIIYPKVGILHLTGPINLNTSNNLGVTLDFEGAEIILEADDAGFILGQTGSGIKMLR